MARQYLSIRMQLAGIGVRVYVRFECERRGDRDLLNRLHDIEAVTSHDLSLEDVEVVRERVRQRLADEGEVDGRPCVIVERRVTTAGVADRRYP